MTTIYGGIEAGGTKFVCAIGSDPDSLQAETQFPTTTPDETITRAVAFFRSQSAELAAVGIAAFGPVDLNPGSQTYGHITTTPKAGWANADLAGAIPGRLRHRRQRRGAGRASLGRSSGA